MRKGTIFVITLNKGGNAADSVIILRTLIMSDVNSGIKMQLVALLMPKTVTIGRVHVVPHVHQKFPSTTLTGVSMEIGPTAQVSRTPIVTTATHSLSVVKPAGCVATETIMGVRLVTVPMTVVV